MNSADSRSADVRKNLATWYQVSQSCPIAASAQTLLMIILPKGNIKLWRKAHHTRVLTQAHDGCQTVRVLEIMMRVCRALRVSAHINATSWLQSVKNGERKPSFLLNLSINRRPLRLIVLHVDLRWFLTYPFGPFLSLLNTARVLEITSRDPFALCRSDSFLY